MTNEEQSFYKFNQSPTWAQSVNESNLIELVNKNISSAQDNLSRNTCFLKRNFLKTSEDTNLIYSQIVFYISNANNLQGGSINEIVLHDNQTVEFHNIQVIRNGKFVDKVQDTTFRVLDNESDSNFGTIGKSKKINYSISDLRLEDTLVLEYTLVHEFVKGDELDKKYYRYVRELNEVKWLFSTFEFKVLNERSKPLTIRQKYFYSQDETNKQIETTETILQKGQDFEFKRNEFSIPEIEENSLPTFEIATTSTWTEIQNDVYELYGKQIEESKINYEILNPILKNATTIDEKIKSIIDYVQNNIVYLYDAEVMHRQVPQDAKQTLEYKSGDCKAKSLLLIQLLKAINVESEFILVNYQTDPFIIENLPSPFVFNHAIVKINFNNKEYFVDPTWKKKSGLLEYRVQPYIFNYLPVIVGNGLVTRNILSKDFKGGYEEIINIKIKKGSADIEITDIYFGDQADKYRNGNEDSSPTEFLNFNNNYLLSSLGVMAEKEKHINLIDPKIEIISDDKSKNTYTLRYTCKFNNILDKNKILKFYPQFPVNQLHEDKNRNNKLPNFYPSDIKMSINIESDNFIQGDPITEKEIKLDNAYFTYKTSKKIGWKSLTSTFEYSAKHFTIINHDDIKVLNKDYKEINNSNFGIGVVFSNIPISKLSPFYLLAIVFLLIRIITLFTG